MMTHAYVWNDSAIYVSFRKGLELMAWGLPVNFWQQWLSKHIFYSTHAFVNTRDKTNLHTCLYFNPA